MIPRTTDCHGHRPRKRVRQGDRSAEQQAQQASGYNRECPDYGKRSCAGHIRFSFPALLDKKERSKLVGKLTPSCWPLRRALRRRSQGAVRHRRQDERPGRRRALASLRCRWPELDLHAGRRSARRRALAAGCRLHVTRNYTCTRRSSCALMATTRVLANISTAPIAGDRTNPYRASTPAASGIATMLYPAVHQRFWIILR